MPYEVRLGVDREDKDARLIAELAAQRDLSHRRSTMAGETGIAGNAKPSIKAEDLQVEGGSRAGTEWRREMDVQR